MHILDFNMLHKKSSLLVHVPLIHSSKIRGLIWTSREGTSYMRLSKEDVFRFWVILFKIYELTANFGIFKILS